MSRLIEANALKEPLIDEYKKLNDVFNETSVFKAPNDVALYGALMQEVGAVIGAIDEAPTVEAIPIEFIQQWISELDDFISHYGGVNKYDSLTEHYIEYTKVLNQLMKRWINHEQN